MKDYSVTLRDSTGKTFEVGINADTIMSAIRRGDSESKSIAVYEVEQNAFANAIHNGDIGEDCWIESYNY